MISKKAGVAPLGQQIFTFMWGSSVKNWENNKVMGAYVDLANIAVQ
jgi:hypothetical protein